MIPFALVFLAFVAIRLICDLIHACQEHDRNQFPNRRSTDATTKNHEETAKNTNGSPLGPFLPSFLFVPFMADMPCGAFHVSFVVERFFP
jgi:hypothetical protein